MATATRTPAFAAPVDVIEEGFTTVVGKNPANAPIVFTFEDGRTAHITPADGWSAQEMATQMGFGRIVSASRPFTRAESAAYKTARHNRLQREREAWLADQDRIHQERREAEAIKGRAARERQEAARLRAEAEKEAIRLEVAKRVLPEPVGETVWKKCRACGQNNRYAPNSHHCKNPECRAPGRLEVVYV